MNRGEMRSRVRSVVRDTAGTFVTDDDINDWLEEANIDLAARLRLLQGEDTGTTTGNSVTLPTDFIAMHTLRLGTEDDVMFTDDDVWTSYSDEAVSVTNTLGRIWEGAAQLYPTPADGTAYALRYYRTPVAMSDTTDSELPVSFHTKMVNYARAHASIKDGEQSQANMYFSLYEQGLPPVSRERERLTPGPMTMRLEPGPFDLDPEARHI